MGKQSRRKSKGQRKKATQQGTSSAAAAAHAASINSDAPTIHKLKHGDTKTKHNLLITLQGSIVRPSSKQISLVLLQAIREQVMSKNLDCAIAAADCIVLYLSSKTQLPTEHQSTASGWVPLFLGRIQDCEDGINRQTMRNHWCALAASCVQALCYLIEMTGEAIDRLEESYDVFWPRLLSILRCVINFEGQRDELVERNMSNMALFAARALHSAIDENPDMLRSLSEMNAWNDIKSIVSSSPKSLRDLPAISQLHFAGFLVLCHQQSSSQACHELVLRHVIDLLVDSIAVDVEEVRKLEARYVESEKLWKTQQEDSMLEDDIMKAVETRKESSRDIARRQKTNPRQEKAKFGERVDGQQEMQVAVSQWEQCVNPLHVALEVSANLLGSMMQDEDAMSSEQDEASNLLLAQAMGQKPFVDRIIDLVLVLGGYRLAPHETASNLRIDVVEVISKALACLSNIAMGETVLAEALGKNGKLGQLWQMLKKSLDVTGATSAMVVFTRSYAVCRAQVVGDDFNFVLHQMLERTPDESVQIDTLSMLASAVTSGIASLDAVVEQMTVALLKLPQTGASAQLVCETLNALIDIYSDDDLYAEIFRRLNVLNHFQNCLGKVSQQSLMSEHTAEILANVEAFIDYKLAN